LTVIGSLVGTEEELGELLQMAVRDEIMPVGDIYEFEKLGDVLEKLAKGQIIGRAVMNEDPLR